MWGSKVKIWGFVNESVSETVLPLHKERFVFPLKCACNIMNYTRFAIWSIGQTLQKIQTDLFNFWTIWTGWYLWNFCQVGQCEFSPTMCMKCEAFYRKPHILSKTHNASSIGSTFYPSLTMNWPPSPSQARQRPPSSLSAMDNMYSQGRTWWSDGIDPGDQLGENIMISLGRTWW